jgi:hypothetical protein
MASLPEALEFVFCILGPPLTRPTVLFHRRIFLQRRNLVSLAEPATCCHEIGAQLDKALYRKGSWLAVR